MLITALAQTWMENWFSQSLFDINTVRTQQQYSSYRPARVRTRFKGFVKSQPGLFEWSTRIWLICKFPGKLFHLRPERGLINQQLKEINTYINSVRNMLSSIVRKIEVWRINWLRRKARIKTAIPASSSWMKTSLCNSIIMLIIMSVYW